MKVNIVTYQKVFPLSPYVNEKIGVEVQVDEGENPNDAFIIAKQFVEDWHKENNPGLPTEDGTAAPAESIPVINRAEERTEMLIDGATTLQELLGYKNHITTPKLAELYSKKLSTLK